MDNTFTDNRGTIKDILVTPDYSITHITFNKGAVRANHYHEKTTQHDFVLKGKVQLHLVFNYRELEDQYINEAVMEKGDVMCIEPMTAHAYKALEYSEIISICFGVRKGSDYEKDVIRLKEPLL